MPNFQWVSPQNFAPRSFTCGFCGKVVASALGYHRQAGDVSPTEYEYAYICPNCGKLTSFLGNVQVPGVAPGVEVANVPTDIDALYREARNCVAVASHTSAVLTCRKLLMNIAVAQGAEAGKTFIHYVEYLAEKGFVPPHGKGWVDHIRRKSNEANHEIVLMRQQDAEDLVTFIEMLLKFIYEFPSRVPAPP